MHGQDRFPKRTDPHRPSVIEPDDYEFVSYDYLGNLPEDCEDMFDEDVRVYVEHQERTGGVEATHDHGGTCMMCGASALWVGRFYHAKSNTYLVVGNTCVVKLQLSSNAAHFKNMQQVLRKARHYAKQRDKARQVLTDAGVGDAWDVFAAHDGGRHPGKEEKTVCDIVARLVRWGDVSTKQLSYLGTLLERIKTRPEREARYAAERAQAEDAPVGKATVCGVILKTEKRADDFDADRRVWTVKDDRGFVVWGTIPRTSDHLDPDRYMDRSNWIRGDRVRFTATFSRSNKDPKFGFYKRPRKASAVELVEGKDELRNYV